LFDMARVVLHTKLILIVTIGRLLHIARKKHGHFIFITILTVEELVHTEQ
jgi:hypothetical protein